MGQKKNRFKIGNERLLYLIAILAGVVLLVSYIWFNELYRVAIETEREWLVNSAKSQARFMEAVAEFDAEYSSNYPSGSFEATLSQIKSAHKNYEGFGNTGEYTLARREGDKIVFLLRHRHTQSRNETDNPEPIQIKSGLAIPMILALEGKSGTVIGVDYRGVTVLAAFEPVKELNLGIVAKMDMEEIRKPFIMAGVKVGIVVLLFMLAGAGLSVYVAVPLISRLQKDEIRMRHLFENANDAIFIIDPETRRFLDVNENAVKRLGYSREEILQLRVDDIASPNSTLNPKTIFMELKEKGSFILEHIHRRKDGTDIPVETSSRIVEFDDRKVILTSVRDVSERKKVEEALRENNEVLERVFETTHIQMVMLDSEFNFIKVNKAYSDSSGFKADYFVGKNHFELFPSEELESRFRNVVKTGEPYIAYSKPFEFPDQPDRGITYWDLAAYPIKKHPREVEALLFTLMEVTERKRAEEALKESEDKLSMHVERTPLAVIEWNTDFEVVEWNPAAEKIFGYTKEEIIGKHASLIIPDSTREITDKAWKALLEDKSGASNTNENITKSGEIIMCEWYNTPLLGCDGTIIGVASLANDITERKKAGESLEEKIILVQLLQEVAIAANESLSRKEALQTAIDLICQFLSWPIGHVYTRSEDSRNTLVPTSIWNMADKEHFKVWHEKTMRINFDRHMGLPGRVLASGEPAWISDVTKDSNFQRAQLAKDLGLKAGFAFPVMVHGEVEEVLEFFAPKTIEPFSELLEVMANVGVQLGRVIERKKAEEALKESEEKYRTLFENSLDMVYMLSGEGKFIDVNSALTETLGYSREEMLGENPVDFWLNPEDRESYMTELELNGFVKDFEFSAKSKSGKKLDFVASATLERDENGKMTGIQGILRDITERKRVEQEMIKVQKLESVGLLAGGIAHDFNNLLMLIAGNISLLKIDYKEDSNTAKQLQRMEKALARAKGLTNQLLTFSMGGAPVIDKADISRIVNETAEFAMRGSKSKCNLSIERNLPYVKIDEDQISQVIQNIVINASHSMSEGGIISINTESKKLDAENELSLPRGEYIKISIGDQGEGISSEHISKIFDPYFTTKVGGTGLGLSTSYSIVQKHNGLLTVDSEQGVGTSFHIYLPVCEGSAPVFKEEKSSAVRGEGRILVMDDEKKIRETIGEMLSILGYVPILTSSGEEAIKKYKESIEYESAFDAVILDLTIPGGMGGKETIKRLREISPDIIGLVSSGYSNDPVLSNFQEYGFKGAVKKPYSIVKLSEMLQTVLADSVKPSPV